MTDKEKIALIDKIIGESFEWTISEERPSGFYEGILCAISAVLIAGEGDG